MTLIRKFENGTVYKLDNGQYCAATVSGNVATFKRYTDAAHFALWN